MNATLRHFLSIPRSGPCPLCRESTRTFARFCGGCFTLWGMSPFILGIIALLVAGTFGIITYWPTSSVASRGVPTASYERR